MSKHPNILFITSDQQRGDCYGHKGRKVKTPHLDQLAKEGTRLDAAICPSLACQPSRASILTGLLPLTHGVHDNGIDLDDEVGAKGFAGSLSAAGYRSGLIGKAHFSTSHTFKPTGKPECVESSVNFGPDWFGPYQGFDHVELMILGHNWFRPEKPPRGLHFEAWFHKDGRGDELNALYAENASDTHGAAQTWHSKLPTAYHNTTWTTDRAIDFIREHGTGEKRGGNPFCLWVSYPDPHHPFDCPEPWSRLHPPSEVDLPPYRTRNFEGRPWWHKAVAEGKASGPGAEIRNSYSKIPPQTDEQLREIISNTYGQIAFIDHSVGRLLLALRDAGLNENTYVVYTSDHGDWLGDHGLILKGPMAFEGLLNVGALVRGPGVPAGKVSDQPVSTMDLGATFLDWAGAAPLGPQHGKSLRKVISDGESREFARSEWELLPARTGVGLSLRTVRTRTAKMTIDLASGAGELYDLANDPHELVNLFDDPAAGSLKRELTDMINSRPADEGPIRVPVGTA